MTICHVHVNYYRYELRPIMLKNGLTSYCCYYLLVLDTAAGVWLDRNGLVTSSKTGRGLADYDPSLELMRRCRHASASVGVRIYVYGGLKGGKFAYIRF